MNTQAQGELVLAERPAPHVLMLRLNRPEARNALNTALLAELRAALDAAAADADTRVVVLTGGPDVFAAGADVREMADKTAVEVLADPRQAHWHAIGHFPKPIVAAVCGYCLGGGHELALLADIVVAGEGAKFGQPEVKLGLMPGAGGTQRLTRRVGPQLAMKMILTGAPIDAATALAAGLVAEVVPDGEVIERAVALASAIAGNAPVAVRLAREAVRRAAEADIAEGLAFERKAFALLFATEDRREGVAAFLEKRKPSFRGV